MVSQGWGPNTFSVLCREASTVLSSVGIWIRYYHVLTEKLWIPRKHHLFGERHTKLFIPLVKRMRACHILVLRSNNWCTGHRPKEVTIYSVRVNDKSDSGWCQGQSWVSGKAWHIGESSKTELIGEMGSWTPKEEIILLIMTIKSKTHWKKDESQTTNGSQPLSCFRWKHPMSWRIYPIQYLIFNLVIKGFIYGSCHHPETIQHPGVSLFLIV